jgi:hypothetical protein
LDQISECREMTMEAAPGRGPEYAGKAAEKAARSAGIKIRRGRKETLLSLAGMDRRTRAYQDSETLIGSIEADLGGADHLTAAERQLVQHGAILGAVLCGMERNWISGKPLEPSIYCTLVNAQRRVFETIGLHRRARDVTPDLRTYLADSEASP